jgi:hypothetical protein
MIKKTYIASLENNVELLKDFVGKMSQAEIDNRIKDFWTIRQHVEHLAESQNVLLQRIELFLKEERPVIKPYTPKDDSGRKAVKVPINVLVEEFERIRNQQIELIKKAGKHVWEKTGEHPEFKKYNFDILVRHALLHDGFHMWRMEELWIKMDSMILELNSN